jgi:putative ABC transport system permease protein
VSAARFLLTLFEGARSAAAAVRANALRSALTALGVIIGVSSIVAIVSLIEGLKHSVERDFQGLGSEGISLYAYTSTSDMMKGVVARLTEDDIEQVRRLAPGVREITPVLEVVTDVSYRARTVPTWVRGTTASYQEISSLFADRGRFLSAVDVQTRRNVCVVGVKVLENLGIHADPLGTYLQIEGEWFKVIGVMEKKGDRFGIPLDDYVIVPYTKARGLAGSYGAGSITAQIAVAPSHDTAAVIDGIKRVLRRAHHLKPGHDDDFRVKTNEEMAGALAGIMRTVTFVAIGIVGISLLVGGIGIMNIMLVSVSERTREIGLRKAIGARGRDILLQFMIEAILICGSAGLIGILVGVGVGKAVTGLLPFLGAASTPWWAVALSFGFATATGAVFGIVPAMRAAAIPPLVSLQHE